MNTPRQQTSLSKLLSLVLRHEPQHIGLVLDPAGWTDVSALLAALARHGHDVTAGQLQQLVASSDKQRFALSQDGLRIRANQGHSVPIALGLDARTPPDVLYHGTATRFVDTILQTGLDKRERHHVHLSADISVALSVGTRYGTPVLLQIAAARMAAAGHVFFRSENGVWLVDLVPADFISVVA